MKFGYKNHFSFYIHSLQYKKMINNFSNSDTLNLIDKDQCQINFSEIYKNNDYDNTNNDNNNDITTTPTVCKQKKVGRCGFIYNKKYEIIALIVISGVVISFVLLLSYKHSRHSRVKDIFWNNKNNDDYDYKYYDYNKDDNDDVLFWSRINIPRPSFDNASLKNVYQEMREFQRKRLKNTKKPLCIPRLKEFKISELLKEDPRISQNQTEELLNVLVPNQTIFVNRCTSSQEEGCGEGKCVPSKFATPKFKYVYAEALKSKIPLKRELENIIENELKGFVYQFRFSLDANIYIQVEEHDQCHCLCFGLSNECIYETIQVYKTKNNMN